MFLAHLLQTESHKHSLKWKLRWRSMLVIYVNLGAVKKRTHLWTAAPSAKLPQRLRTKWNIICPFGAHLKMGKLRQSNSRKITLLIKPFIIFHFGKDSTLLSHDKVISKSYWLTYKLSTAVTVLQVILWMLIVYWRGGLGSGWWINWADWMM